MSRSVWSLVAQSKAHTQRSKVSLHIIESKNQEACRDCISARLCSVVFGVYVHWHDLSLLVAPFIEIEVCWPEGPWDSGI